MRRGFLRRKLRSDRGKRERPGEGTGKKVTFRDFQIAAYAAGIGGTEFWEMTVTDISRKIEAHQRNEQSEWERARLVSYFAVMPHLDSKKGNMTMQKMIPFPWDEAAKPKRPRKLTEADKKWLDDMDKLMKKRHGQRNN